MKINKKIIFISGTPVSKIVGEKIDPQWFFSKGYNVEYWNLTNLYYSKKALDQYFGGHPEYRYNFPVERKFYNSKTVKNEIKKLDKDVFFCFIDFLMQSNFWILRCFKIHNIHYYVGPRRTSHAHEVNKDPLYKKVFLAVKDGKLISKIRGPAESNINNLLLYRFQKALYKYSSYYQKPDFAIGSGTDGRLEAKNFTNIDNFISIRSIDVMWNKIPNLINEKYCVYVDESIIYSPDRALFNDNVVNSKQKNLSNSACDNFELFLTNMCSVFKIIEKKLECKIVIACSGKYKYMDESIYGGRKMIYGSTHQLIKNSEIVIGHNSTGLYQAIIDKKNIIAFTDSTLSSYKNSQTLAFAKMLNVRAFETSSFQDKDLDNLNSDFSEYIKIEERYFKERNTINDYRQEIIKYFENTSYNQ